MNIEVWGVFVATVLALMSTPGPSQLLMLSNSMTHGFQRSVFTALGDLSANFLQMLAAGLGLAVLLTESAYALTIIKWAGVAYLLWLGWQKIRNAEAENAAEERPEARASLTHLWMQGFTTSAANPKAVVFFAALFPQFIDPAMPFWPQFLVLSATYIAIDGCFLSSYGLSASWLARKLRGRARAWLERAGGGFLIAAAILLGLRTASER